MSTLIGKARDARASEGRGTVATGGTSWSLASFVGGSAGNVIEWYDFLIYSVFSIYFAPAFFPAGDATAQLVNATAVAALGYVARPVGSWLMGAYADRRGRRASLSLSVTLMCVGSLCIAAAPTYASVGVLAPVLLVAARLVQGLSMGGEYGTSATYLSELAPRDRRGLYVGFLQVTVVLGQLLALAIMIALQFLLDESQLRAWGWRLPFVVGGILAVYALYLRRGVVETDVFKASGRRGGDAFRSLVTLSREWRRVALAVGITVGGTVSFYTFTVYMQKYMVNTVGLDVRSATTATTTALFVYMLLQPLFGHLSDVFGRRPVLVAFGVGGTFLTVPLMETLGGVHDAYSAFGLNLAGLLMLSGFTSIHMLVKSELFPTDVRALGVGLPYAVTTAVLGGTTEFTALKLKQIGHESSFYYYVSACCAVSLLTYLVMPETRNASAIDRAGAALGEGAPSLP